MYLTKTAHAQADECIDCSGIAEVDARVQPWALLQLDDDMAAAEAAWHLVGAYAAQTDALAARRRLNRGRGSDYDMIPPSFSSVFPKVALRSSLLPGVGARKAVRP